MKKKQLAIMQPYFLPYLGYFQLMKQVDEFIIYDNIQFTKKGWIHRNRILQNKQPIYVGLPLRKDSDFLDIKDRYLADIFSKERVKSVTKISEAYRKAAFFKEVMPLVENIFSFKGDNLFEFVKNSINLIRFYLEIDVLLIDSSQLNIDHNLKGQNRVIAMVSDRKGKVYINPEGGKKLYSKDSFASENIDLKFHHFTPKTYNQFSDQFVSHLSIIDVLMHCGKDTVLKMLTDDCYYE